MIHKTEDYKISAVKYYINNEVSMEEVCEIFEWKKTSLKRWIDSFNYAYKKVNLRKYKKGSSTLLIKP